MVIAADLEWHFPGGFDGSSLLPRWVHFDMGYEL